ncbi:MAG TPA: hypothetical protein VGK59_12075 [Ohtaekwangia sp.]
MNFEEYLISKKIDNARFSEKEQALWRTWKIEFEQMHPNSFTVQKLNLINPIRRKYPLKVEVKPVEVKNTMEVKEAVPANPVVQSTPESKPVEQAKPVMPKPAVPRPVFKPKPKTE